MSRSRPTARGPASRGRPAIPYIDAALDVLGAAARIPALARGRARRCRRPRGARPLPARVRLARSRGVLYGSPDRKEVMCSDRQQSASLHHLAGGGRLTDAPAGGQPETRSNAGPDGAGVRASGPPLRHDPEAPAAWRRHPRSRRRPRPPTTKEHAHGRGDDRPQPQGPPRVPRRGDVRGGHRADRDGDQVDPRRPRQPPGGLRPDRARRGLARRRPHRARMRGAIASTTRRSGPGSCSSTATRSTSSSARRSRRA